MTVPVAFAPISRQLAALDARGRSRTLMGRSGIDFASNDYLALGADPVIAAAIREAIDNGVPVGAGGSRLLRGNAPEHEALEHKAANFFGSEAALFFGSGFAANTAIFSTLPQRGDLIVADALIHASAHEGIRLAKASHVFTPHNDADAIESAIVAWRAAGGHGTPWIAAESVYSMDGDLAPVADLIAVAERHDGVLVLDEAHGTGVFGRGGRGVGAGLKGRAPLVALHTCGKAMGVEGAIVTGPAIVRDYLVNRARHFVFSTAPSPLMAVAAGAAIDRIAQADSLRAALRDRMAIAGRTITEPLGLPSPVSPILPIVLGSDRRAMAAAASLRNAGFDARGIRPPTVPPGTARLRLTLTLNASPRDIEALAQLLVAMVKS